MNRKKPTKDAQRVAIYARVSTFDKGQNPETQLGPFRILAAGVLLVDPRTPRRLERVELQVEVLLGGGDAGIADFHAVFSYNYLNLISR